MDTFLPPYLRDLNDKQLEAVLHEGAPLLILAGAGSGKTRVITTKITYLIDQKRMEPASILAVTFTNKAAGEMLQRVASIVPQASGLMIRTFHSFGAWLLRRNTHLLEMNPRFTIYNDEDSEALLKSVFGNFSRRELKHYARLIAKAKNYALEPDDDLSRVSREEKFRSIYASYQRALEKMGNVDFGDLILRTVRLLKENSEVRTRIHQRFQVILVDEYQDSNVAQFELLKQLFSPERYICVVGDDDQSIYRFRGAEVKNILKFPEQFPGTEIIRLEQNYRSTKNILEVASSVVNRNRGRLGKTLFTTLPGGRKPVLAWLPDYKSEVEYCARLLSDGRFSETAILYRTNAQSREFEIFFSRHNIPYRIVGTITFYEREEVKDTLSLLNLIFNPRDEIAFRRIINKPSRGIGKASIGEILRYANKTGGDLLRASKEVSGELSGKAQSGVEKFLSLIEEFRLNLESEPLGVSIHRLIVNSGLLEYHLEQDEVAGTQKVKNLEELVNAAAEYPGGMEGLAQFLDDAELDRSRASREEGGSDSSPRVTLITMHNTKGLEFERVIITGLEEGLFPGFGSETDEESLEEERRIFYVSITRAKRELYLTTCRMRRLWGKTHLFKPSRFLAEIPQEYLEEEEWDADYYGDEEDGFLPGTNVYHDEYGQGVVCKRWYNGSETSVLVRFESGYTGRFIPRFSGLERVG